MLSEGAGLSDLPGIGTDLADKIDEIINTRHLTVLDEMESRLPARSLNCAGSQASARNGSRPSTNGSTSKTWKIWQERQRLGNYMTSPVSAERSKRRFSKRFGDADRVTKDCRFWPPSKSRSPCSDISRRSMG